MSTDDGRTAAIPVTERYRAAILSALGFGAAVLMSLSDALVDGRPLGGIEVVNVVLGAVVMAAVYWPASPWVKLASGVAGSIVQWLAAAWTDGVITGAEWATVGATFLSAVLVGAFPNAPQLVTGEAGDDVPDPIVPPGSTYGGPRVGGPGED